MRPSDAEALQAADAVVWVGPGLETFLEPAMKTLAADARAVLLGQADGLVTLPVRGNAAFEKHVHDHGHDHADEHADEHAHEHGHAAGYERDWHVWLDPHNAGVMVRTIAKTLVQVDSAHAEIYRANADSLTARLETMTDDIATSLEPLRDRPFIVFHDAYQYFENRFGVGAAGAIMVQPGTPPGAARIGEIRERITQAGAVCVFTEPQFEPRLARVIVEGTDVRLGTLDPIGADLEPGPELYFTLIRTMADDMRACLGDG
jgi:zinc transport system substrate-binding protein